MRARPILCALCSVFAFGSLTIAQAADAPANPPSGFGCPLDRNLNSASGGAPEGEFTGPATSWESDAAPERQSSGGFDLPPTPRTSTPSGDSGISGDPGFVDYSDADGIAADPNTDCDEQYILYTRGSSPTPDLETAPADTSAGEAGARVGSGAGTDTYYDPGPETETIRSPDGPQPDAVIRPTD